MTARPKADPAVLAALIAMVPARIAKRLDASPTAAEAWSWSTEDGGTFVKTDGEERVAVLADPVLSVDQVRCSCLLTPRCFHVLATLSVLPLASPPAPDDRADRPADPPPEDANGTKISLDPAQTALGMHAWKEGAALLGAGVGAASTLRIGELLRIAGQARRASLPRLEATALAVVLRVRELRSKSPDFRLADAVRDLAGFLLAARALASGRSDQSGVGIARRAYASGGGLRVAGIASEPVFAAGYAGVVTYFTDGARIFTAADVMPGDASRAVAAYDAQLRFGEVSLTHRHAAAAGLLFAEATVSQDGRLGAGKSVTVAKVAKDERLLDRLFGVPFAEQLDRAFTSAEEDDTTRGRGADLVFTSGRVVHVPSPHFVPDAGPPLPLRPAIDDAAHPFRENLERLARGETHVRIVAHAALEETPLLVPIAVYPDRDAGAIRLEGRRRETLGSEGVVSLGFERIDAGQVPPPVVQPLAIPPSAGQVRPLHPLRSRLLRFALAGRASLPPLSESAVLEEARRLRGSLLTTAADCLEALLFAARTRDEAAAAAWLSCVLVARSIERDLARSAFVAPSTSSP